MQCGEKEGGGGGRPVFNEDNDSDDDSEEQRPLCFQGRGQKLEDGRAALTLTRAPWDVV